MKQKIIVLSFLVLSLVACRKDTKTDGPSIAEIYSNFKLLDGFKASKDSVDFKTSETVFFSASFNKIVTWKITIEGQTSKAKKTLSGQSRIIAINNALWNGSTTTLPMFRAEKCIATLKIVDVADSFTANVFVKNPKVNDGFIVADFESGLKTSWTKYFQSGASMDCKVKTDNLAPEGGSYLNMAGTVNWDYLIGLIDFPVPFSLNTNPDAVYFNCLVYGTSSANPSIVLFQFKEDENSDGTFSASNEDEYDYQVTVDWEGWKLISMKYSDIFTLVNGSPSTPKGNGLHNPNKLSKISMLHLANPNNGFAETKLDYLMFSNNKPLEP
jgi:hypothetical protein